MRNSILLIIAVCILFSYSSKAQTVRGPSVASLRTKPQEADARLGWWREARFGMFVHWGVSSDLGGTWKGVKYGGYGEHIQRKAKIPIPVYKSDVVAPFNPTKFNAKEWVDIAKNAGMGYFIITAKHHDGFAMYNSSVSDYNIVKATVFARDPMLELSAECKRQGIKFGFYYSHAFDWGEENGPGNDWDYNNPGGDKLLSGANWWKVDTAFIKKAQKYVDEKSIPQILELIKKYDPDIMWFDTPHKLPDEENCRIMEAARKAKPTMVINGRLHYALGDYKNTNDCPEDFFPVSGDWEGIPTTNDSYGYNKDDMNFKPYGHFVELLAKAVARGGNVLMNMGPKGTGEVDTNDVKIFKGIGTWMQKYGESIKGCGRTPLQVQAWGETTLKGNTLYLHVFEWPKNGQLVLGGVKAKVKRAYLLSDKSKMLKTKTNDIDISLKVPKLAPDSVNSVIAIEFESIPEGDPYRLISADVSQNLLRCLDAEVFGGVSWASGTKNDNYVKNWTKKEGEIRWKIRVATKTQFQLLLNYEAPGGSKKQFVEGDAGKEIRNQTNGSGGSYNVIIGDNSIINTVKNGKNQLDDLGKITLNPGVYELWIKAKEITGDELFRCKNIVLKPL